MSKVRRVVEVDEISGYELYLGKIITIFCCRYIYTGLLEAVNDTQVTLRDASIVYQTGAFNDKSWGNAEKLPKELWHIAKSSVESYGLMK